MTCLGEENIPTSGPLGCPVSSPAKTHASGSSDSRPITSTGPASPPTSTKPSGCSTHTALVNERIGNWEVGGYDVDVEAQNRFELRGKAATLVSRPDLIAHRCDEAVIVDTKTGHESPSHTVQVMIYLYAVPRALERYRNAKLKGQVTYRDHTVRIPAEAIDDKFVQNLATLIRRLSADEPARRVPSRQECRFCDITAADCPARVEAAPELEAATTTTDDF